MSGCALEFYKDSSDFLQNVKVGDLILGTIVSKQQSGMMLKVLCTTGVGANVRYAADINVKVSSGILSGAFNVVFVLF